MRVARLFPLHLLLACAVLFAVPLLASGAASKNSSKFVGVYESDQSTADTDKPAPSMSISLGTDGSATFTQDYGKGAETMFGHWVDSGSQVTVTFDADEGKTAPPPMVFQPSHDGLQAVTWDHAAWGKASPPLMKKTSADWHNKGRHHVL